MSTPTEFTLKEQAKAVAGGVVAGLGALAAALADERVTSGEWVAVALAAVGAYATVFGVRNA